MGQTGTGWDLDILPQGPDWILTASPIPSQDRGVCLGIFAAALVPGQSDTGTIKPFSVPEQRDSGTKKHFCLGTKGQWDVLSL